VELIYLSLKKEVAWTFHSLTTEREAKKKDDLKEKKNTG
jgi:hypothetical protein